jgi:hypothetical protein
LLALGGSFILPGFRSNNTTYLPTNDSSRMPFYDEVLKTYVYAKRELSIYELNEIAKRHKAGENYRSILLSMGLLY